MVIAKPRRDVVTPVPKEKNSGASLVAGGPATLNQPPISTHWPLFLTVY